MPHLVHSVVLAHGTTGPIARPSQHDATDTLAMPGLSPLEEEFFRAGDQMSESHDFSDLDAGYQRPSLWRTLIGWLRGERTQYAE